MLTEAEEVEANLVGETHCLECVADGLGGGAGATVDGAWGVAERVDAELEAHH